MSVIPEGSGPIEIAQGVFWIGVRDNFRGLLCNPFLVTDGNRAAVIDSGSRTEFSQIMMQILKTGTSPVQIEALIYQHYDPDLCSNLPHIERIIDRTDLKVISHKENNDFIRYLGGETKLLCIDEMDNRYEMDPYFFRFTRVPYAHALGNFITYEEKTEILFTSDIFGAYDGGQSLFFGFDNGCPGCARQDLRLRAHKNPCPILPMAAFNKDVMSSTKALRMALKKIEAIHPEMLCPQHGCIFKGMEQTEFAMGILSHLKGVGIDGW